jgi:hypothetical protein
LPHAINRALAHVACAAALVALCSCAPDRTGPGNAPAGAGPDAGSGMTGTHWVQDERLRGVMAELSRQTSHWPAGVPDDPEAPLAADVADSFRQAARLADGLAAAAQNIPRAVADREMSAETRRGFNAEARRLHKQSLELKEAARGRKVERMQRLLDGISSSCISCHSQYRDFTGELDAHRAAAW